jgi:hypothetical protein
MAAEIWVTVPSALNSRTFPIPPLLRATDSHCPTIEGAAAL